MRLRSRLQRLERSAAIRRHLPLFERFMREFDEATIRLGRRPTTDQVMAEIDPFLRELSSADFDSLMAELEPIAFGGDVAAKEAALREIEADAVDER